MSSLVIAVPTDKSLGEQSPRRCGSILVKAEGRTSPEQTATRVGWLIVSSG